MAKLVSSLPLGGRYYVWGFNLSAAAFCFVAFTACVFLSWPTAALSQPTSVVSKREKLSSATPNNYGKYSWKRPKTWDCSQGGIVRPRSRARGIQEGIDEARSLLQSCKSCRQLFDHEDAKVLLKKLDDIGAIFESVNAPTGTQGRGFKSRVSEIKPFNYGIAWAITIDTSGARPEPPYPMIKPCIYVNPLGGVILDVPGYSKEALARARGLVIIHELAHASGMIPHDGVDKIRQITAEISLKLSQANSQCIGDHCSPCSKDSLGRVCYQLPSSIPPPGPSPPSKQFKEIPNPSTTRTPTPGRRLNSKRASSYIYEKRPVQRRSTTKYNGVPQTLKCTVIGLDRGS